MRAVGLVAAGLLIGSPVAASPKVGTGVAAGVAGAGAEGDVWSGTRFYGAVRADLLWGRDGVHELALGPGLEVSTVGFSDARFLLGPSLLVPFGALLSMSLSPQGGVRTDSSGVSPVLGGRALLGVRAYNHYGAYDLGGGLLLGFDRDLDRDASNAVVIGLQMDGLVLALPFVLLAGWIRGPVD